MTVDWQLLRVVIHDKNKTHPQKMVLAREIAERQSDLKEALRMQAYTINMLSKQYTSMLSAAWTGEPPLSLETVPSVDPPSKDAFFDTITHVHTELNRVTTNFAVKHLITKVAHLYNYLGLGPSPDLPERDYAFRTNEDQIRALNLAFENTRATLKGQENE